MPLIESNHHRDGQIHIHHEADITVFYWISGDPPSDSYGLTIYAQEGGSLLTASAFQKAMVATNDRLAGAYLRMWKVRQMQKNYCEAI